jgi:hypothetical protein
VGSRHPTLIALVPALVLVVAALVAACGTGAPSVKVTAYVRNASSADVGLVVRPAPEPPLAASFGAGQTGVFCDPVPIGSQLIVTNGAAQPDPSAASSAAGQLVALIGGQAADVARVVWIDVAADGTLTTGQGKPEWWQQAEVTC